MKVIPGAPDEDRINEVIAANSTETQRLVSIAGYGDPDRNGRLVLLFEVDPEAKATVRPREPHVEPDPTPVPTDLPF